MRSLKVKLIKRSGYGDKKYIKHFAVVVELADGRFKLYEQLDNGIQEPQIVPNIDGWSICASKRDTGKLAARSAKAKASEEEYSALFNNCECYARYLYCGIPFTLQGSLVQIPLFTLTGAIALLLSRWVVPVFDPSHESDSTEGAVLETRTCTPK